MLILLIFTSHFFFLKSIFKYLFKHVRFYKKKWLVDIIKINLDVFLDMAKISF